jgi:pimeloyl-ACP methyl ester carboxylesterase
MAELIINGLKCHYQLTAPAEHLVVYLHGLVMDNLSSGYFTIAQAFKEQQLLLYDFRGHGLSERPLTGYTIDDFVEDLYALILAVKKNDPAPKVSLIGVSFGGLIALAFAQKYPEYCLSLVLLEAHLYHQGFKDQMLKTLQLTGADREQMIAKNFEHWIGRHQSRRRLKLAEKASELVYQTSLLDDLDRSPAMEREDLSQIACPVLAIYGTQSDALSTANILQEELAQLEMIWLENVGHAILWEKTDVIVQHTLDFLVKIWAEVPTKS